MTQATPQQEDGEKCPHCGGPKTLADSVDTMIDRARQMAPKPYQRHEDAPDPAPRAAADNTRVGLKPYGGKQMTMRSVTEREKLATLKPLKRPR